MPFGGHGHAMRGAAASFLKRGRGAALPMAPGAAIHPMPMPAVKAQTAGDSLKKAAGGAPGRPQMGTNNANPELGM